MTARRALALGASALFAGACMSTVQDGVGDDNQNLGTCPECTEASRAIAIRHGDAFGPESTSSTSGGAETTTTVGQSGVTTGGSSSYSSGVTTGGQSGVTTGGSTGSGCDPGYTSSVSTGSGEYTTSVSSGSGETTVTVGSGEYTTSVSTGSGQTTTSVSSGSGCGPSADALVLIVEDDAAVCSDPFEAQGCGNHYRVSITIPPLLQRPGVIELDDPLVYSSFSATGPDEGGDCWFGGGSFMEGYIEITRIDAQGVDFMLVNTAGWDFEADGPYHAARCNSR
jgi:hypothetical protein